MRKRIPSYELRKRSAQIYTPKKRILKQAGQLDRFTRTDEHETLPIRFLRTSGGQIVHRCETSNASREAEEKEQPRARLLVTALSRKFIISLEAIWFSTSIPFICRDCRFTRDWLYRKAS
ncbi:hypothetical protein KIN20_000892 [Parelaphostrongylus tenuis]|uniref:Uncharacterized protein n=1 Tax=Parelaphostrongylus tenuis TaxID=148309 RepID=A0AAD5LSU4_PARTN|nr:hypothetical protein KIN20_000892 [Parelaphostrongylus tenuis]